MKSGIFWTWNLGVSVILLALVGRCLAEDSGPQTNQQAAPVQEPRVAQGSNATLAVESTATVSTTTNDINDAPVVSVSLEKHLPANLRPNSPVAELIKLANSGVDEGVMLAFVTNSTSTFNLAAEEIIYLKDIGVPDPVVTAMILRDQELRTQPATALANATPWLPPPDDHLPPPMAPAETVPQAAPSAANYQAEPPPPATEVADDSNFYDALSPYGTWANLEGYGPCWQPTVVVLNPAWQPYYNCGRWVWTDCGWYWLSDYSWGWAPFHYGRWFCHGRLGWCWAPDQVWGPSWVCWRHTAGYCGWAPLPPATSFTAGVGVTFHGARVKHGEDYGLGPDHYRFVAWSHFGDHNFHHERMPRELHERLFHDSVASTAIRGEGQKVVNDGLPPERVAAATHAPVRTMELRQAPGRVRPVGRAERIDPAARTLTIYRPKLPPSSSNPVRWTSAASAPSAPTARSAPTLASRSAPTPDQSIPAFTKTTADEFQPAPAPRPGQNSPLILRGPQNSAAHESVPPSSLVIIGRKDGTQTRTAAYSLPPWAAASSVNQGREPSAWANSPTPWAQESAARQPATENGQRSPAQVVSPRALGYVPRNNSAWSASERPAQIYRPAPAYQPPVRSAAGEVPRYSPVPANNPQQSASPQPAPAPARPAQPAPSAPAQSGRGQR